MITERRQRDGREVNFPAASPAGDEGANLPGASPELDFAVVLSRVIGSMQNDPAQLRHAVYELARIKLLREAWQKHPSMSVLEIGRLTQALETAIRRVEAVSSRYDELQGIKSLDCVIRPQQIFGQCAAGFVPELKGDARHPIGSHLHRERIRTRRELRHT